MLTHANLTANTAQVGVLGPRLEVGRREHSRRPAAVSRLRHDGRDERRRRQGRKDHPDAALPACRSPEADPPREADHDAGRADDPDRHAALPRDQILRSFVSALLHFGRRTAARGSEAEVRSSVRRESRRRLRPVGSLARSDLQSDRGRTDPRLHRTAASRHRSSRSATSTIRRGKSRRASAASFAPRARKS